MSVSPKPTHMQEPWAVLFPSKLVVAALESLIIVASASGSYERINSGTSRRTLSISEAILTC